jgi:hypothetical protein
LLTSAAVSNYPATSRTSRTPAFTGNMRSLARHAVSCRNGRGGSGMNSDTASGCAACGGRWSSSRWASECSPRRPTLLRRNRSARKSPRGSSCELGSRRDHIGRRRRDAGRQTGQLRRPSPSFAQSREPSWRHRGPVTWRDQHPERGGQRVATPGPALSCRMKASGARIGIDCAHRGSSTALLSEG